MAERDSDVIFTIEELSGYLKVSKSSLYKLAQDGKIPAQKVGRHWRFHKATVDKWLASRGEWKDKERN